MSDQVVEIAEYDPAWPDRFAGQQGRVTSLLDPWLAGPVEHIGSTAVPGLPAKPVIDMLAPVHSLDAARDAVGALETDGWMYWPADPNRHYRLWLLRPLPETRTHHLHVIQGDDPHAQALLAFRDALRADPDLCSGYAQLKKRLAQEHRGNRNRYSNAKSDFVEQALRAVGVEVPLREPWPE